MAKTSATPSAAVTTRQPFQSLALRRNMTTLAAVDLRQLVAEGTTAIEGIRQAVTDLLSAAPSGLDAEIALALPLGDKVAATEILLFNLPAIAASEVEEIKRKADAEKDPGSKMQRQYELSTAEACLMQLIGFHEEVLAYQQDIENDKARLLAEKEAGTAALAAKRNQEIWIRRCQAGEVGREFLQLVVQRKWDVPTQGAYPDRAARQAQPPFEQRQDNGSRDRNRGRFDRAPRA
jgi:hypothetical protein